jgi:hypothetical protein
VHRSRSRRRFTAAAVVLLITVGGAPAAAHPPTARSATGTDHVVDPLVAEPAGPGRPAGAPVPPGPAALASGASAVQDQGAWDFFRLFNQGRVVNGLEPTIPNVQMSRLASDRALAQSEAGTLETDPDLDGLLPPGWSGGQQAVYRTIEYDPASAARVLADLWLHDDWLDPDAPVVTDVGIGLVEKPFQRDQKEYTLYVVGTAYPHSTAQAGEMTLYRFSRPDTGTHFYSTSAAERDLVIGDAAFRYEGPVAYVLRPSVDRAATRPLHRFYRPGSGTHFYTSTQSEYTRVLGFPQYALDGVAGTVYTSAGAGRVPMYRFFRPASGTHFYTASAAEAERVERMPGYTFEGTAFYLRRAT